MSDPKEYRNKFKAREDVWKHRVSNQRVQITNLKKALASARLRAKRDEGGEVCETCGRALEYCGEQDADGPTLDCMVCKLRDMLNDKPTPAAVSAPAMEWLREVQWGETGSANDEKHRAEILATLTHPKLSAQAEGEKEGEYFKRVIRETDGEYARGEHVPCEVGPEPIAERESLPTSDWARVYELATELRTIAEVRPVPDPDTRAILGPHSDPPATAIPTESVAIGSKSVDASRPASAAAVSLETLGWLQDMAQSRAVRASDNHAAAEILRALSCPQTREQSQS